MTVTPATIATALGVAAPASGSPTEAQWQMWIDDALRHIQRRASRLSIDFASLNAEDVDYVVRESVVAHVRNPDDATQVAVSVDDSSVSRSYRSSQGRVTILDEWWELLGLIAKGGSAYSVRVTPTWDVP
jgi:hypothetical protein